ncbi:EAL domain-containing protein [Paenibacillus sp. GCM10023248]|uniref:EAL domain-containing protein n=1 Tax=Bacillales TaxID=1385 RepID=UPI0023781F57|nr:MULTISPECIES: EAL domain-containing protein [Bacillales]MDD9270600.1 EAL domain-containing protein [Paenibacillus sp. MAHUQ-63]MDR6884731.1 EAL domain-containing protein (putative c-di-GMP-specific phosphodiesterase class I) [Bacillus sp. 3255]
MRVKDSRIPLRHEVRPFFQPILSLQTQEIIGYETLGRRMRDGQIESLGPFFNDPDIPEDMHLLVDRHLRERAIEQLNAANVPSALFINLKPSWIYRTYKRTGVLPTLELLRKYRIDPAQIVIEITEEEFTGKLQELTQIVELYREFGCTVAIDDVGSGFSNFDRIASLEPKILKIDLNLLKKSAVHAGYKALMQSFSILAGQIGASLLVEGVETKQELHHALQTGARYVQGYLFSKAEPYFQHKDAFKPLLKEEMSLFGQEEFDRYSRLLAVHHRLDALIHTAVSIATAEDADQVIERTLQSVTDNCIRMYICREDGYQISSNYIRKAEIWSKDVSYRGANWTWRPYFISNILMMNLQKQGMLSQVYTDLDTSQQIQTYSCALGEGFYLFLDLLI